VIGVLQVKNLCQRYGKTTVFSEVSFELPTGSFLALLGPNGTGKTTLLKSIGMMFFPEKGTCVLDDEDLFAMTAPQRARRMAYLPQSTHAPFPMQVIEAVLLGRFPYTAFVPKQADREKAAQVLERLGLSALAFRDLSHLSGGERQQVFLARALVQNPRLLLLDEPTSNLDLKNQLQTMQTVRSLCAEEGLTAIAAIHDLNLAAMFCDHFLILHQGRLSAFGGEEVLTPELIHEVYGVAVEKLRYGGRPFILPCI